MAKSKYIEALEEQYTKKDAKSVLRYKAPDNKWRYIQTSKDASGGNIPSGGGMTEVTWQELKDKRDNGELSPGSLYRITDYQCTTTQENTQSAGHQFDIVLLALSEDKLTEEGWAMQSNIVDMFNDYDIYTFTFSDGVSKEYYLKIIEIPDESDPDNPYLNTRIVDVKTFRGNEAPNSEIEQSGFIIDDENKTATNAYVSSTQFESYLQIQYSYNYFQNSNLSAWKVWYCLDNDKDRFAWADDGEVVIKTLEDGTLFEKRRGSDIIEYNGNTYYQWQASALSGNSYTLEEKPTINSKIYAKSGPPFSFIMVESSETIVDVKNNENGRGVIYRLIDEWGNDCPYDFKNIQFNLGNGWYAPFYAGVENTRDASLDGTFANNKVVPNGEGLLGIISNNTHDVKGCIFVHTNQTDAFQPSDGNVYNIIIKNGNDLELW